MARQAVLFGRRIHDNRSTTILIVLVCLSLVCLASDTRAAIIGEALRTGVSVVIHPFWVALNAVQRGAEYTAGFVFDYHQARKEVENLRREVSELVVRAADRTELLAENARLREMLLFQRGETALTLLPAKVMASQLDGTLRIDLGSKHGIREDMGVLTNDGVIGIVAQADPFQSTVYTLNHPRCKITAIIERSRVASWVQGSGSQLSDLCNLVYIDMAEEIRPGDLVVTNSSIRFPRGIPIGTIVEEDPGSLLLKAASVKPAANPYKAEEVFVVIHAQPNPEDLTGPVVQQVASAAPAMPDLRTEQEKFAP
jgi:rod shape-determining protein MreC